MMSFNDIVHEYCLKSKATSIIKIHRVFSFVGLDNSDNHQRDGPFSSDVGFVNLHQSEGTPWFANLN